MARAMGGFRALAIPPPQPGRAGDPGLFGPGSVVWHVGRERVLMAGGAAALLLQLANPLVAEAVAGHSSFREDPLARLRATLDSTLRITFGDARQAASAAASVAAVHRPVRGRLREDVGTVRAGTPYAAEDPDLAMWVHATLVWSAMGTFERFVGTLSADERARYYEESRRFARLFGVTERVVPATHGGFAEYWGRAVAGLAVSPSARQLGEQILRPPLPFPLRVSMPAMRGVTASLLPDGVRTGYGLLLGSVDRAVSASTVLAIRHSVRVWPARVRYWPHYLDALRRLRTP